MTLDDLLANGDGWPLLLVAEGPVWRGDAAAAARRAAAGLAARGIGPGCVVAADAAPSPGFVALLLGAALRGATLLPVSTAMPAAARARVESQAGAALSLRAHEFLALQGGVGAADHAPDAPAAPAAAFHPAAAIAVATSGSIGLPRVIRIPWSAAIASAQQGAHALPFGPGDAWLASLSAAHVGGIMILVRAVALGGAACIAPAPRSWADLAGITHVSVVAAQLARLLEDPADPPASLKAVLLGGGPSPQALRDAALARGLPLFATYGLTETCSQVATGRLAVGDPATLAGPAIAPTSIWAEADELLIDGPTLADAELREGATVPLPRPLRTRDHGFIDAQGRVHVVGRHDTMFISGGKNIHPETIERALGEIPGVRAACVVGVPDPRWGMRPVAFVDLVHPPAQPLRDALAALLERHLVPDAIYAMPADEAEKMKPSRAALAARLSAGEPFESR